MPELITHKLSYQLETGNWLFQNINLNLGCGTTGLVGRNGVGKSVLVSLLYGITPPTHGAVTCRGKVALYSQLPAHLSLEHQCIAELLGINDKLLAIQAIERGSCDIQHYEMVGDDWDIEARTLRTLRALGIKRELHVQCCALSGGQLALLRLHQLFSSDANILLLDEPSNHLDCKGKQWLLTQLQLFRGKVLLVSHDRSLLRHANAIYQLTSLGLDSFNGNYDAYLAQSASQITALDRQIMHLSKERKKIERQVQVSKEKMQQRASQGNRLRKSGSQAKCLLDAQKDKAGQGMNSAVTNQQNQLRRNKEAMHIAAAQREMLKPQVLYLQQSAQTKQRILLQIENCQLNYSAAKPLSFEQNQHDRCHLKGANGCGKTTLIKAIHGEHINFTGKIRRNAKTVYLDQYFELLEPKDSLLVSLMISSQGLTEQNARTLLAGIGFRGDCVHRTVEKLSGGEKMKLSMLMVCHVADSPLLLLDEPDNHLDQESKQILATALRTYKGSFVLVSHDQDFVDETAVTKSILME